MEMIRFSIEVCELHHKSGRHFIFEQPQSSRAWGLDEVMKLAYQEGVERTTFRQCMYGLEARDHRGVAPAYKPTSVLSNHPALVEVLQTRCSGNHRHAQLIGKSACTQAACYPSGLCTAVMKRGPSHPQKAGGVSLSAGQSSRGPPMRVGGSSEHH